MLKYEVMSEKPETDFDNELDTQLMLRVRDGDAQAMESLVKRHQDVVFSTVSGMLKYGGDVEDIAQQVFIRIWKNAASYEPSAKFKTWMFTILRNLVFNEMRRNRRKPFISVNALEEDQGIILAQDSAPAPDEHLDHAELVQAVEQAIGELPERERLAVNLRRFDQMAYEEIASILGISVAATKSILFRARNKLKEKLAGIL